jgi:hypothetical protein
MRRLSYLITLFCLVLLCSFSVVHAQGSAIARIARMVNEQSRSVRFLEITRATPLGEALAPALEQGFKTNEYFRERLVAEVLQNNPDELRNLLSSTNALLQSNVSRMIDEAAAITASNMPRLPQPTVELNAVDFIKTYDHARAGRANIRKFSARTCEISGDICITPSRQSLSEQTSFSVGCQTGPGVTITTKGNIALATTLPDGKIFSVPVLQTSP